MGILIRLSPVVLDGAPHRGAALRAVQGFVKGKTLAQAEFTSAEHFKAPRVPRETCFRGTDDPTNPVYITTVWGYGYKWGF